MVFLSAFGLGFNLLCVILSLLWWVLVLPVASRSHTGSEFTILGADCVWVLEQHQHQRVSQHRLLGECEVRARTWGTGVLPSVPAPEAETSCPEVLVCGSMFAMDSPYLNWWSLGSPKWTPRGRFVKKPVTLLQDSHVITASLSSSSASDRDVEMNCIKRKVPTVSGTWVLRKYKLFHFLFRKNLRHLFFLMIL